MGKNGILELIGLPKKTCIRAEQKPEFSKLPILAAIISSYAKLRHSK